MASLQEIQIAFDNAVEALANELPDIVQGLANDAKAMVQLRIQSSGTDADGNKFPPYSETELPSFFLGAKKKKTKNYKQLREERGLQTEYVDLTFTGQMWRNTGIIDTTSEGGKYIVTVGGRSEPSENKIDWNSDRYGDILRVSSEEEEVLERNYNDKIQEIIDIYL